LKVLLLVKGSQRILVVNIPWYLNKLHPKPSKESGDVSVTVLPGVKAE
jgi:hypothetical protein